MTFDDYARYVAHGVQTHAHARATPVERVLAAQERMGRLACARLYPAVPDAWEQIRALALGAQVAPFSETEVAEAQARPVSAEEILGPCPEDPTKARLWRAGVVVEPAA